MILKKHLRSISIIGALAVALAFTCFTRPASANVYATNIKLNGSLTSATVAPGVGATITYILNEPAPSGVTIKILSGGTAVRTITGAGALRGLNTVIWDGTDDSSVNVPGGNYSVSITAASTGYGGWTRTTADTTNPGNQVWEPRGIAVDRNTNSPYYGRVFAANCTNHAATPLGYQDGILKCNADGSYADEGGFSTGGHTWANDNYSPWRLRVSDDDYVYVNDFTGQGAIFRWDPTISTPSGGLAVLRSDNWTSGENLTGLAIFGTGINTEIWMADNHYASTAKGIIRWHVNGSGVCALNDKGTQIVKDFSGSDLIDYPEAVALDSSHNIYTVQNRGSVNDVAWRVLKFPPYSGTLETTATWKKGSVAGTSDWCGAQGIAVDPTGTYVAVGFRGQSGNGGNTKILATTDGHTVATLDLGVSIGGYTQKADYDVDWDAVGNVYLVDEYYGCWRAYSPPGANSATTLAVASLVIAQINITNIAVSDGTVTINFTYATSDPASAFTLLSSATVNGTYSPAAGAVITGSAGSYQATVPTSGPMQFYRIKR